MRFARNGAPKETISGFTRQPSNSRDPFSVRFAITVILLFNRRVGKSRIVKQIKMTVVEDEMSSNAEVDGSKSMNTAL